MIHYEYEKPLTEEQWLSESSPVALLRDLWKHRRVTKVPGGQRRLWRFNLACCHLLGDQITDDRLRRAIEVCERCVGQKAGRTEVAAARDAVLKAWRQAERELKRTPLREDGYADNGPFVRFWVAMVVRYALEVRSRIHWAFRAARETALVRAALEPGWKFTRKVRKERGTTPEIEAILSAVVRCIFGNPFAPVLIDEAWLSAGGGAAKQVARDIHETRAFDRMPILADALEDAGCADRAILKHCRDGRPHARGCHVLDALLGTR